MTRPITTAPADTARAMHGSEMRGQDMQDAPERIWAWVWDLGGYGQPHGRREWVDFRPKPFHVSRFMPTGTKWWQVFAGKAVDIEQVVTSYTRTDLCITEAECQRRIDAAVLAERQVRTGAEMTDTQALRDLLVKVEAGEWWGDLPRPDYLHTDLCWKAFNGSLDAAKALHDAVLPGWGYHCGEYGARVWLHAGDEWRPEKRQDVELADQPARAWLICIIRAIIAQATP